MQHVLNLLGVFCVIDNLILKIIFTVLTEKGYTTSFRSIHSTQTPVSWGENVRWVSPEKRRTSHATSFCNDWLSKPDSPKDSGVCLHSSRGLIAISDGDIDVCPCVYSKAQSQAPSEPCLMLHLTYSFFFSFLLFFAFKNLILLFVYLSARHWTPHWNTGYILFYFLYWQQRVSLQPYISFSVDQFDHSL